MKGGFQMTDEKGSEPQENQFVIDQAQSRFSDIWKKEDYWAI